MAQSDETFLESLKTARDNLLTSISDGEVVIEQVTSGRTKRLSDPAAALQKLDELIAIYERKIRNASHSPNRAVSLRRASVRGN